VNKALLTFLCVIPLLVGGIIGFTFFSSKAEAQVEGIIIADADYNSTITTEYSADLINITKSVTLRIVMEYGDFNSKLDLNKSDDLNQAASIVSSRITVEYADFISTHRLQGSENLTQIATTVTPRIIVEYADFIFSTDLGPKPMEDVTPPNIGVPTQEPPPEMVMPNQNVTVSVNITDTESGVKNATLHYNINNSATWITLVMSHNSTSNLYYATIPGQPEETLVKYKIMAYDNAENVAVEDKNGQYYVYTVIPEFPSSLILLLFTVSSMLAVVLAKKLSKKSKPKPNFSLLNFQNKMVLSSEQTDICLHQYANGGAPRKT